MDYIFLCAILYLLACLSVGLYRAHTIKTFKEYAMGSSSISTFALVATICATRVGAGSTFGTIERIINDGAVYILIGFVLIPIPWALVGYIFSKNVERFKGCMTPVDILEKQYGLTGKILSQIISITFGMLIIAVQFMTLQSFFSIFFGVDQYAALIYGVVVMCVYTIGGGIRGVILTDILQASLFMIVMPLLAFLCLLKSTHIPNILELIPPAQRWLPTDLTTTIAFIHMCLYVLITDILEGPFVQRILISGQHVQLRRAFLISGALDMIRFTMLAVLAFACFYVGSIHNRTDMLHFIMHDINPALSILTLLAILAAVMSTADSWINTITVVGAKMLYKAPTVKNARYTSIGVCIIGIIVSMYFKSCLSILNLMMCVAPFTMIPLFAAFLDYKVTEKDLKRMLKYTVPVFVISILLEGTAKLSLIPILLTSIATLIGPHLSWRKKTTYLKKKLIR